MVNSTQAKRFSWTALLWLLIYFWYFSSLLQIYVVVTGQSNTVGLRDSLLYSTLWLIPALFFPRRIKLVAGIIGIILWLSSVIALAYFVVYGHQISQSVMFVMFETNTNEAGEFLRQYISFKVIAVILIYTLVAIFLWSRLKPVTMPVSARCGVSLLVLIILFGVPYYNKGIKQDRPFANVMSYVNSKLAYAAPWQFVSGDRKSVV